MSRRETSRQVGEAILELMDDDGVVTPKQVVDAARDKASPLHRHFEWDDDEAAEKYRLNQARGLIRSVKVEIVTRTRGRVRIRKVLAPRFLRDPEQLEGGGYRDILRVQEESEEVRHEMIADEFSRASHHLRRARIVALALGLDPEDIDGLLSQVRRLQADLDDDSPRPTA